MKNVGILGGGIIGLAIAYELSKLNFRVSLFEKEKALGRHQSGNNSGVLHCGLYYKTGSLKANLSVEGIKSITSFCEENDVPHEICGKVLIATNDKQVKVLEELSKRGLANGLKGLKFISGQEMKNREPNVIYKKSLLVPQEGIIDFSYVVKTLRDKILQNDGEIHLNSKALNSLKVGKKVILKTTSIEKEFDLLINCTGLYSDKTYEKFTQKKSPVRIIPFRGEYLKLKSEFKNIVNHLIYPVPDSDFPFLGVHYTRTINGNREVGPNAVLAFKREGYKTLDFSFKDTYESLTYVGLRKFVAKNPKFSFNELRSSFSKKEFVKKAKNLIPEVEEHMFEDVGTSGVRAQALNNSGKLIMDFSIIKEENTIHVLNAPSPGATSCLSIAKHIITKYVQ